MLWVEAAQPLSPGGTFGQTVSMRGRARRYLPRVLGSCHHPSAWRSNSCAHCGCDAPLALLKFAALLF